MSVKRNIAANYVGQIFASALALALVPVHIGYLSIEAYALVGLFAVAQAWLTLLDLGLAVERCGGDRLCALVEPGVAPVVFRAGARDHDPRAASRREAAHQPQ
ncbi:hypothetical protein KX816_02545 [Sphingosinicellaceae bacterium]|nr:hypothetical protein KX816_02545 [Sphingosinicellaceae bacterium]